MQQIVEYDLLESMKENSRNLVITFSKRIYQTAIPTSMTLIYNSRKNEDQILIADSQLKFRIFDKNTFEILATFMGPIYDSYVKQFVSKNFNIYIVDMRFISFLFICGVLNFLNFILVLMDFCCCFVSQSTVLFPKSFVVLLRLFS